MTNDDLKSQLDRIEAHGKNVSDFLGCLKFFLVVGLLVFIVVSIIRSWG